jgi:hypothetical protein
MHDQDFEEVLLIFENEDTVGGHGSPSAMYSWNDTSSSFRDISGTERRLDAARADLYSPTAAISADRAEQFRRTRCFIRRELVNHFHAVTRTA